MEKWIEHIWKSDDMPFGFIKIYQTWLENPLELELI